MRRGHTTRAHTHPHARTRARTPGVRRSAVRGHARSHVVPTWMGMWRGAGRGGRRWWAAGARVRHRGPARARGARHESGGRGGKRESGHVPLLWKSSRGAGRGGAQALEERPASQGGGARQGRVRLEIRGETAGPSLSGGGKMRERRRERARKEHTVRARRQNRGNRRRHALAEKERRSRPGPDPFYILVGILTPMCLVRGRRIRTPDDAAWRAAHA